MSALLVGQHSIKFVRSSDIGGTALGGGAVVRHAEVQGFIAFRSCCNLMHIHHACHPRLVGWLLNFFFPNQKLDGFMKRVGGDGWQQNGWMDGWKFRSVARNHPKSHETSSELQVKRALDESHMKIKHHHEDQGISAAKLALKAESESM